MKTKPADQAAAAKRKPAVDAHAGAAGVVGGAASTTTGGTGPVGVAPKTNDPKAAPKNTATDSKAPPAAAKPDPKKPADDAGNLDAKLPAKDRPATVQGQKDAKVAADKAAVLARHTGDDPQQVRRASLAAYYKDHPAYVDPGTGKVYQVTYDEKTGHLTGTRKGDTLDDPEAGRRTAAAAKDRQAQDKAEAEAGRARAKAGAVGGGAASAPTKDAAKGAQAGPPAPSQGAAAAAAGDVARSIGGIANQLGVPAEPVDSTIDVAPDGTTTIVQSRGQSNGNESHGLQQTTHYDADGTVVDARRTQSQDVRTGTGTKSTSTEQAWGAGGTRVSTTARDASTSSGQTIEHAKTTSFANDQVSHVNESWHATRGKVEATETHDVNYADGQPKTETIVREADNGVPLIGHAKQTDQIELGPDGLATKITSDYPDDKRDLPNQIIASGVGESDSPFFALGRVEARPGIDDNHTPGDKTDDKPYPGSISAPGATVRHEGILVTVEGADANTPLSRDKSLYRTGPDGNANQRSPEAKFAYALDTIDSTPAQVRKGEQLRFTNQPAHLSADGLAYAWSTQNKSLVFFGGNTGSAETYWHESAHAADGGKGAPNDDQWRSAATADAATREQVLATIPAGSKVTGSNPDLLNKQLGTDNYGTTGPAPRTGPNDLSRAEDWAEATSLYLQSRRDGGLVTVQAPDGTKRELTFEDLYPERAKILKSYYDDFSGWQPPAPAARRVANDRFPLPKDTKVTGGGAAGDGSGTTSGSSTTGGKAGGASSSTGGTTTDPGAGDNIGSGLGILVAAGGH